MLAIPGLALHCRILVQSGAVPHWLEITLVALHVLGAAVWVGGTIALTFIAVPAIRILTGEPRQTAMRRLGERWRPIGWTALLVMVATGAPLASHVLPDSDEAAKAVFAAKMCLFAALLVFAYLHDFVLGPKVAREIREGRPPLSRTRLVVVGWASFTLTVTIPILGVVLAETA
jgi:copper resistance protein D